MSRRTKDVSDDDDDDELPLLQLQMKRRAMKPSSKNKNSSQWSEPKVASTGSGGGVGRRSRNDDRRLSLSSSGGSGAKSRRSLRHTTSILEACASPEDEEPISQIVEALRRKKANKETVAVSMNRRGYTKNPSVSIAAKSPATLVGGSFDLPSYREPESPRDRFQYDESVLVQQSLARDSRRVQNPRVTAENLDSLLLRSERFKGQVVTGSESSNIVDQARATNSCPPYNGGRIDNSSSLTADEGINTSNEKKRTDETMDDASIGIPESLKTQSPTSPLEASSPSSGDGADEEANKPMLTTNTRGKVAETIIDEDGASIAKLDRGSDLDRSTSLNVALQPIAHLHAPQDEEESSLLYTVSRKKRKNKGLKNRPATVVQPGLSFIDTLKDTSTDDAQALDSTMVDDEWSGAMNSPSIVDHTGNPDPKQNHHANSKRRKLDIGSSERTIEDDSGWSAQFVDDAEQRDGSLDSSLTLYHSGQPIVDGIAELGANNDKRPASIKHTPNFGPAPTHVCDEIRVSQRKLDVGSSVDELVNNEAFAFLESPWSPGHRKVEGSSWKVVLEEPVAKDEIRIAVEDATATDSFDSVSSTSNQASPACFDAMETVVELPMAESDAPNWASNQRDATFGNSTELLAMQRTGETIRLTLTGNFGEQVEENGAAAMINGETEPMIGVHETTSSKDLTRDSLILKTPCLSPIKIVEGTETVESPVNFLSSESCASHGQRNHNDTDISKKVIVFCGHSNEPGNKAFRIAGVRRIPDYLSADDRTRKLIVAEFMEMFEFRKNEVEVPRKFAVSKIMKLLGDSRYIPRGESALRKGKDTFAPVVESCHLHRFTEKGATYIEELAFHHYAALDPAKYDEEPLPPPGPIPGPPLGDLSVKWIYDESSRVFVGDFSNVEFVSDVHKRFLSEIMERDDITVICEGLLGGFQNEQDFLDSMERTFRKDPHHKFRRFVRTEKNGKVLYHEIDGYVSIHISEFRAYLQMLSGKPEKRSFVIRDQLGRQEVIAAENAREHVFYMIDVDMPKTMIRLNEEYKRNFKIKEILPGGAWCMLNHLADQSRPFMGPNCYITPGGGYTQVHQDGHGSVDSGHSNVKGFNEVVMLRRLPECHKRIACRMVPSFEESCDERKDQNMLYRLPHDDGREDKPKWPTIKTIESWRAKNYCPSVFILKEGQHVLINKGRLHAFRKLTIDPLPQNDCHALLRADLVHSKNWKSSPLCVSIAFDWMFMGLTPEGINRELASTLECTALCRKNKCKSLAIPETSILKLASGLPKDVYAIQREKLLLHKAVSTDSDFRASWIDIARGILPSLRHIVKQEFNTTLSREMKRHLSSQNKTVADSTLDSSTYVDPHGNDYFCKLCDHELSNTYYHCEGCELLLSKDFNICALCFGEKRFMENVVMHDGKRAMHSNRHHVGRPESECKCDCTDVTCEYCNRSMTCCCCTCHTVFSKRCRFYSLDDLKEILEGVEKVVGDNQIEFAVETEHRLNGVVMVPASTVSHDSATENSGDCEPLLDTASTASCRGSTIDPASEGNDGS